MDYAQMGERYIEILHKTRELAAPQAQPGISDDELLALIRSNAAQSLQYTIESNRILDELLFSRTPASLTDEDIGVLSAFADKLFKYSGSDDACLAYHVHRLLLEAALCRSDEAMYIKELYLCGITLFYTEPLRVTGIDTPNSALMRSYFETAAKFFVRYEVYDKTSRSYIIRSLGNCRLLLPRVTDEDVVKYYRIFDRAMAVICSSYYRSLDPDLPWDNYEYSMNFDQVTIIPYLNAHRDPESDIAQRVWRAANYVYLNKYLHSKDEERLQNWRMKYFYEAARYNVGKCSAHHMVSSLLRSAEKFGPRTAEQCDDSDNISDNVYRVAYAIHYSVFAEEEMAGPPYLLHFIRRKIQSRRLVAAARRCIDMLIALPADTSPRIINTAMQQLMETLPEAPGLDMSRLLSSLVPRHRPTYIHSLMVAMLTKRLVRGLLQAEPAALIGVRGYTTEAEIAAHGEELCELAYNCGLYHDLGKGMIFMFVSNNARRLTDEEFANIKLHPVIGAHLIREMSLDEELADAAMYHHCFYDGRGGYPANAGQCPPRMKAIVDALSVADSLDAATDSIGRCYSAPKPYDVLLEEMRAESGSRYSPAVLRLFDDEAFYTETLEAMQAERRKIYLRVYRDDIKRRAQKH